MRDNAQKHTPELDENEEDRRVTFVRVPKGADASIFGGWGVKI